MFADSNETVSAREGKAALWEQVKVSLNVKIRVRLNKLCFFHFSKFHKKNLILLQTKRIRFESQVKSLLLKSGERSTAAAVAAAVIPAATAAAIVVEAVILAATVVPVILAATVIPVVLAAAVVAPAAMIAAIIIETAAESRKQDSTR